MTTRSGFVICSYFREGASPAVERYVKAVPLVKTGKGKNTFLSKTVYMKGSLLVKYYLTWPGLISPRDTKANKPLYLGNAHSAHDTVCVALSLIKEN